MNWKDAPHLFVNGKFKFTDDGETVWEIIDYETAYKRMYAVTNQSDTGRIFMKHCTLIARKIEDITDEELTQFIWGDLFYEQCLPPRKAIEIDSEHETGVFLALLSLGVYPFDQSHFEDGTVIDINEVEK